MKTDVLDRLATLFPQLSEEEARVALATYRLLARNELVATDHIAEEVGVTGQVVEKILDSWPGIFRDETGAVIGFWGLTSQKMTHRFIVLGRTRYAWCAWDTLFMPEILGSPAEIDSSSGLDRRPVRLHVAPDAVTVDPGIEESVYVSFRLPTGIGWEQEIVKTFCHHVHFLLGEESERWVDQNPGGIVLPLEHAFIAGQCKNRSRFGTALRNR